MFSYSTDNNGHYPDGKSSTEVFQKLLDGGYCVDPAIFYIPLPGKTKPVVGKKLKPENVCFDVTIDADSHSSDKLPLVFMTGYEVTYMPGGSAVPIIKPYPRFRLEWTTWDNWWYEKPTPPGIAVFYIGNSVKYMNLDTSANSGGSIPNFIPPDFKPDGKTYRQLTPDGPLSP